MLQFKTIIVALFCMHLVLIAPFAMAENKMHVVFINPDPPGSPFWDDITAFMMPVSRDLDIKLDVVYGDRSRFKNKSNFLKVLNQNDKPDYIITVFQESIAPSLLALSDKAGIKVFALNTDLSDNERRIVGYPREKYQSWIGHLWPDDEQGGYLLGKNLINLKPSQKVEIGSPFEMFGMSGSYDSSPAENRNNGIKRALLEAPDIHLKQIAYGQWSEQNSYDKTTKLLKRYPNASFVFCAGGAMTSGVIKAIQTSSKTLGDNIFLGSFDWSQSNFQHIRNGDLAAIAGGHFMDGGWSLILLYDYHNGIDFKSSIGTSIHHPLSIVTRGNVEQYEMLLNKEVWEDINFKKLTKTHGGLEMPYNLTIDALLKLLDFLSI